MSKEKSRGHREQKKPKKVKPKVTAAAAPSGSAQNKWAPAPTGKKKP